MLGDGNLAIGTIKRKGLAERHLNTGWLSVHEVSATKELEYVKSERSANIADLLTKYFDGASLDHCRRMEVSFPTGRDPIWLF